MKFTLTAFLISFFFSYDALGVTCRDLFDRRPLLRGEMVPVAEIRAAPSDYFYGKEDFDRGSLYSFASHDVYTFRGSDLLNADSNKAVGLKSGDVSRDVRAGVIVSNLKRAMDHLYESFAKQGEERRKLLPDVKRQDREEQDKIVHFMVTDDHAASQILHLQVQVQERIHVEEAWGPQLGDLARKPGEKLGEAGRLTYFNVHGHPYDRQYIVYQQQLAFLRAWTWALRESPLDRMLLQVNDQVFRRLIKNGIPLDSGTKRSVWGDWNGTKIEEYVISYDRAQMRRFQEKLAENILIFRMKGYLLNRRYVQDRTDAKRAPPLVIPIEQNEINLYRRLGLIEVQTDPAALRSKVHHLELISLFEAVSPTPGSLAKLSLSSPSELPREKRIGFVMSDTQVKQWLAIHSPESLKESARLDGMRAGLSRWYLKTKQHLEWKLETLQR